MMYNLIQKIHLYIALSLLLATLMYFFSGYVMIHVSWFGRPEPQLTEETRSLPRPLKRNETNISEYLQKEFKLPGRRVPGQIPGDGNLRFSYWRPGEGFEVILSPDMPEVTIKHRRWQWQETVIGFHRMHNYGGGWIYTIWALLLDIVSLSLIVFGITGIYMWYKLTKKRLPGWILLSITYTYTMAVILYLVYAP